MLRYTKQPSLGTALLFDCFSIVAQIPAVGMSLETVRYQAAAAPSLLYGLCARSYTGDFYTEIVEIGKLLLDRGSFLDMEKMSSTGRTPLMAAARAEKPFGAKRDKHPRRSPSSKKSQR
jgi:hypothetical protein